jgi:hypothetical protein
MDPILISWCSSPFWLTPSPEQLPSRRKLSKSRHAVNSGRPSMMTPYPTLRPNWEMIRQRLAHLKFPNR